MRPRPISQRGQRGDKRDAAGPECPGHVDPAGVSGLLLKVKAAGALGAVVSTFTIVSIVPELPTLSVPVSLNR